MIRVKIEKAKTLRETVENILKVVNLNTTTQVTFDEELGAAIHITAGPVFWPERITKHGASFQSGMPVQVPDGASDQQVFDLLYLAVKRAVKEARK